MNLYLDIAEVKRQTGRTYKSAQKRVLRAQGIPFGEDDAGRPLVLRSSIERKILGRAESAEPARSPDFSAFPVVA